MGCYDERRERVREGEHLDISRNSRKFLIFLHVSNGTRNRPHNRTCRKNLQISGQRSREQEEEKTDTWHRMERTSGRFACRFRLPESAKVDDVKAATEDGVLTVTVPKEGVKKPDVRSVQVSG